MIKSTEKLSTTCHIGRPRRLSGSLGIVGALSDPVSVFVASKCNTVSQGIGLTTECPRWSPPRAQAPRLQANKLERNSRLRRRALRIADRPRCQHRMPSLPCFMRCGSAAPARLCGTKASHRSRWFRHPYCAPRAKTPRIACTTPWLRPLPGCSGQYRHSAQRHRDKMQVVIPEAEERWPVALGRRGDDGSGSTYPVGLEQRRRTEAHRQHPH